MYVNAVKYMLCTGDLMKKVPAPGFHSVYYIGKMLRLVTVKTF